MFAESQIPSAPTVATPSDAPDRHWASDVWVALHVGVSGLIAGLMFVAWLLTGLGWFWPEWVWFALAVPLAVHLLVVRSWRERGTPEAGLRARRRVLAFAAGTLVAIWLLDGLRGGWPAWPVINLAMLAGLDTLLTRRERLPWRRAEALAGRVDELTRTRRGALDVQAAELRRIERDLHDGAQARLVAISMQLGRAEHRLEADGASADPALLELIRAARQDATAAVAELRDLARGISPPVLADRGLMAAVDALAQRHAMPVSVTGQLPGRLAPVIESAAYFVVAEALTNVAKHAEATTVDVSVVGDGTTVTVRVQDDGRGGADPNGSGLMGLRRRAEALDGTLTVTDGPGTIVEVVLPCGS